MFLDLSEATGGKFSSVSVLPARGEGGHQVAGAAFAAVVARPEVVADLVGQGVLSLCQASDWILEMTRTWGCNLF